MSIVQSERGKYKNTADELVDDIGKSGDLLQPSLHKVLFLTQDMWLMLISNSVDGKLATVRKFKKNIL